MPPDAACSVFRQCSCYLDPQFLGSLGKSKDERRFLRPTRGLPGRLGLTAASSALKGKLPTKTRHEPHACFFCGGARLLMPTRTCTAGGRRVTSRRPPRSRQSRPAPHLPVAERASRERNRLLAGLVLLEGDQRSLVDGAVARLLAPPEV